MEDVPHSRHALTCPLQLQFLPPDKVILNEMGRVHAGNEHSVVGIFLVVQFQLNVFHLSFEKVILLFFFVEFFPESHYLFQILTSAGPIFDTSPNIKQIIAV